MDETAIRQEARRLLRQFGPQTVAELYPRISPELLDADGAVIDVQELGQLLLEEPLWDPDGPDGGGHDPTADPDDPAAADAGSFAAFPLSDGRVCDLDHLLDGLTSTHRITATERADGEVVFEPDLVALHLLSQDGRSFPSNVGTLTLEGVMGSRLRGPDGWLPPEPILVIKVRDGQLEVSGATEVPTADGTTAERLAQTLARLRDLRGRAVDGVEIVFEARARYPRILSAPAAPMGELLTAAGLRSTDHGVLGIDEEEPDPHGDAVDTLIEHLRDDHGLGSDELAAVLGIHGYVQRLQHDLLEAGVAAMTARLDAGEEAVAANGEALDDETHRATVRAAVEAFDHDAVGADLAVALGDVEPAMALVEDVVGSDPVAASSLFALLLAVTPTSRARTVRANSAWVRARLMELVADDHADAEVELRRAREFDEGHGPAAFDLARYLSDRGQAGAAVGLLRRIEGPAVDDTLEVLEPYVRPGPTSAGRNDPCPCGSGRKHKVCCQARGGWPLQDRLDWVWHKIMIFVTSPYAHELVEPIVAASGRDPDQLPVHQIVVMNLALYEGGLLAELCDLRGSLLPADELELLRRWSRARAGAYELVEAAADGRCTALDLRTGDRVSFVDRSLAGDIEPGTAVLMWLIEEPDGPVPSHGVVMVPDQRRRDLLDLLDDDPGAVELAHWYRSLSAPPQLATTAGDPLVMTTMTYEVADGEAARTVLAGHLEDDGDSLEAFEERDGQRWLRGSVEVDGDRMVVTTSSASRAVWFQELLAAVLPEATLVDEERIPIADLVARPDLDDGLDDDLGDDGPLDLETMEPVARAQVEEHLARWLTQHEDGWVDTPLPALDGVTPRQAVDDPTRRPALERLLDDMARSEATWAGPGRGMSAERLRGLLGL